MKKLSLLLFSLFLLTGCKAVYNLDLTNESIIEENLDIVETNKTDDYFEFLKNYNGNVTAFYTDQDPDTIEKNPNLEYYEINNTSTDDKVNINFNYDFNENVEKSNIINTCFENVNYISNDKVLDISAANFTCFSKYITLEHVTINIKTNKDIKNHNADNVSNNTYTWNITKQNYYNKVIKLSTISDNSEEEPQKSNNKMNLFIILGSIALFIVLIIGLYIYKNRKYNSN